MKKILAITIAVTMFAALSSQAATRALSKRMDGLNPELADIVMDEYTDLMYRPANILAVDGSRIYTNLANNITGTDRPMDNNLSVNELSLGAVFDCMLAPGKTGLFIWSDSAKTDSAIWRNTYAAAAGAGVTGGANPLANAGLGVNGELDNETVNVVVGGANAVWTEKGTSVDNQTEKEITGMVGLDSITDFAKVALFLRYENNDTADIEQDYEYSFIDAAVANSGLTQDYEATQEGTAGVLGTNGTTGVTVATPTDTMPTFNTTKITIAPDMCKKIGDMTVNAGFAIGIQSGVQSIVIDDSLSKQAAWTAALDPLQAGTYTGVGGGAYTRTYSEDQTLEVNGMELNLSGKVQKPLNDSTNLIGLVGFQSAPLSGDGENTITDSENDNGTIVSVQDSSDIDYEKSDNTINLGAGIVKEVNPALKVAAALLYTHQKEVDEFSETAGLRTTTTAAASTLAYGTTAEEATVTETTNRIQIPVGLELMINKVVTLRLGNTWQITTAKTETEHVTTTTAGGATAAANVVTDIDTTVTTGSLQTEASTYYSGIGLAINENLQIDATNVFAASLLNMVAWEVGVTLKF